MSLQNQHLTQHTDRTRRLALACKLAGFLFESASIQNDARASNEGEKAEELVLIQAKLRLNLIENREILWF